MENGSGTALSAPKTVTNPKPHRAVAATSRPHSAVHLLQLLLVVELLRSLHLLLLQLLLSESPLLLHRLGRLLQLLLCSLCAGLSLLQRKHLQPLLHILRQSHQIEDHCRVNCHAGGRNTLKCL